MNNIVWVNWLKVIGTLSVVLGHINNPYNDFLYSWHMPLFFMISGFFIKAGENVTHSVFKDFKRLMVPYFIFSMIGVIITSIKMIGLGRESLNYADEVIAIFYWMDYSHLRNSYGFVLWFLPCLFFSKVLFYLVNLATSNMLVKLLVFVMFFIVSFNVELPFALTNALNASLWLFLGREGYRLITQNDGNKAVNYWVYFMPTLLMISTYYVVGLPSLNMSLLAYSFKVDNVIWACSFVYFLALVLKKFSIVIDGRRFINFWAKGGMLVFVLHPYTNNIAHIIVEKIFSDVWQVKFLLSLLLLFFILKLRALLGDKGVLKYV